VQPAQLLFFKNTMALPVGAVRLAALRLVETLDDIRDGTLQPLYVD
jgi:hypothetical protein